MGLVERKNLNLDHPPACLPQKGERRPASYLTPTIRLKEISMISVIVLLGVFGVVVIFSKPIIVPFFIAEELSLTNRPIDSLHPCTRVPFSEYLPNMGRHTRV
jgi:hypothetical protein